MFPGSDRRNWVYPLMRMNDRADPRFVTATMFDSPAGLSIAIGHSAQRCRTAGPNHQPTWKRCLFSNFLSLSSGFKNVSLEILSAYDDLIENNRRRMALLEEAARQLYREWFVRLRFPGHEHTRMTNGVPEGWKKIYARPRL